jgi:DNA mismatch repair protein MutS2
MHKKSLIIGDTTYHVGDSIYHKKTAKSGVIQKILSDEKVSILIGSLNILCSVDELLSNKPGSAKKRVRKIRSYIEPTARQTVSTLDLHGLTVADALVLIEQHLSKAILAGQDSIQIVHGIGTGALKAATHAYLRDSSHIHSFTISATNPGMTIAITR